MEKKNESEFEFQFEYYRHTALDNHKETIKQHREYRINHKHDENPTSDVKERMKEFKEDNKYHKMREKCIKKYSEIKQVPKIQAPDKYFCEYDCHRDKPSEEELYPNDKEISLYENGNFVVRQVSNTCYFMASILGLIDQGRGNYIKEKMIREYEEDKTKAIVRLRDEDGLPVDIIVDKTRFGYRNRPLWLIMLDKAVCVMMNRNKFGVEKNNTTGYVPGMNRLFDKQAKIVERVDWYEIEKNQKNGEEVFNPKCFTTQDIGDSGEATGFKLLFGKKILDKDMFFKQFPDLKSKTTDSNKKNNNMMFLEYFLERKKLVIGSANGLDCAKIWEDHVMYFKSYDKDYVYGIESMGGNFKIPIANFNKMSNLYAAEFPRNKKKSKKVEIANHQEDKKTNKNEMENNNSDDVKDEVGNSEMIKSKGKINSSKKTETKTENIIDAKEDIKSNTENDKWSNNLDLINSKINVVDEGMENKKINIDVNHIKKADNTVNNDEGNNINITANCGFMVTNNSIENNENKQFINWKFVIPGILFFVDAIFAFCFDTCLFISIVFLVIGLFLIVWGIKNKLKACVAYKFFAFSSPKQNKPRYILDKNRDRIDNNNLKLTNDIYLKNF